MQNNDGTSVPEQSDDVERQLCPRCAVDESDRSSSATFEQDDLWWVQCECGLTAPTANSEAGAIALWNMLSMTSPSQDTYNALDTALSALKSAGFTLHSASPFDWDKARGIIENALVQLGQTPAQAEPDIEPLRNPERLDIEPSLHGELLGNILDHWDGLGGDERQTIGSEYPAFGRAIGDAADRIFKTFG